MISLLADANIQGHITRLVERMQRDPWREFWEFLDVRHLTFAALGLDPADKDSVVWQRWKDSSFRGGISTIPGPAARRQIEFPCERRLLPVPTPRRLAG